MDVLDLVRSLLGRRLFRRRSHFVILILVLVHWYDVQEISARVRARSRMVASEVILIINRRMTVYILIFL